MPYLTQEQYIARFGQEELDQVLATDDTLDLEAAIADAEAIVNGYLVMVPDRAFAVPLPGSVPSRIVELTADLTRYEIHAKKVTHEIKRRRNEAIEFLADMVKGLVGIPELLPGGGAVEVSGGAAAIAECPVFTSCSLRGYVGR